MISELLIAAHLLGGVGTLMSPNADGSTTPGGGFAITTEANDPLATESDSVLVTEDAP